MESKNLKSIKKELLPLLEWAKINDMDFFKAVIKYYNVCPDCYFHSPYECQTRGHSSELLETNCNEEETFQYVLSDKVTLTLYSKPDEDNINRAMNEIPTIWEKRGTINRKNGSSYGMKHILERHRDKLLAYNHNGKKTNCYICNNDFIIAMHRLGYKLQRCPNPDWNPEQNPNFVFNAKTLKNIY